jgi:hypothetical protein
MIGKEKQISRLRLIDRSGSRYTPLELFPERLLTSVALPSGLLSLLSVRHPLLLLPLLDLPLPLFLRALMLRKVLLLRLDLPGSSFPSLSGLDLRGLLTSVLNGSHSGDLTSFLHLLSVSELGLEPFVLLLPLTFESDPSLHLLVQLGVDFISTLLLGRGRSLSLCLGLASSETFELSDKLLFLGV